MIAIAMISVMISTTAENVSQPGRLTGITFLTDYANKVERGYEVHISHPLVHPAGRELKKR
jgi:hypothetical protein